MARPRMTPIRAHLDRMVNSFIDGIFQGIAIVFWIWFSHYMGWLP